MDSPGTNERHEKEEKKKSADSVFTIFRYADWVDVVLMVFGTIGAIGDGMSTNCLLLFASRLMNNLGYGQNQTQKNNNHGNWMDEVEKVRSSSVLCSQTFELLTSSITLSLSLSPSVFPWFSASVFT